MNNIIPTSRLNPIALNYLKLYPLPNIAGQVNGENNYGIAVADSDGYDNELGRLDFNISDKNKLSFDFRHNYRLQHKNLYFGDPGVWHFAHPEELGDVPRRHLHHHAVADSRPSRKLDPVPRDQRLPGRWHRSHDLRIPLLSGGEFTVRRTAVYAVCQRLRSQCRGIQCVGMSGDTDTPYDIFQVFTSIVKITGNHTIKAGVDLPRLP